MLAGQGPRDEAAIAGGAGREAGRGLGVGRDVDQRAGDRAAADIAYGAPDQGGAREQRED